MVEIQSDLVNNGWSTIVHSSSLGLVLMLAALVLTLFATGIAAAVFFAGWRLRREHVTRLASIVGPWVWAVPVLGMMSFVGWQATRHFQEQTPATIQQTAVGQATTSIQTGSLPRQDVLRARQMSSDVPNWASQPGVPTPDGSLVTLSSERFATLDEAEQQVTRQALEVIRQHFHEEFPNYGAWQAPVSLVEKHAVQQSAYEVIDKDFGLGFTSKMYRAHVQLKFTPDLRKALYGTWRAGIVEHRLLILGTLLGLATLILGTTAIYFRLDDVSFGMSSCRLKVAAAALITAGGLVAARLVH